MRISSHLGFLLSGAAAVALLAGCAGGGAQAPAANAPLPTLNQSLRPVDSDAALRDTKLSALLPIRQSNFGSTHRTAFVNVAGVNGLHGNQTIITDAASATVTVWGGAGQLNAILFDGILANPRDIATDVAENLYVPNAGFSNVIVYAKPYTSVKLTLNDANESPQDVAVSQTGLVGVMNYLTTSLQPGSVSFYAKGSTSACATVQDSKWIYFVADGFDASGNLFIDGQDSSGNVLVGEVSGGCRATSIKTLRVANTINLPGSVQVYHGNILIGDPQNRAIYTYAPPTRGSLGSPTATTTLAGSTYPVTFAMMEGGQNVWTADFNAVSAFAGKYTYPGGSFVTSINDHLMPIGVVVNPAARP